MNNQSPIRRRLKIAGIVQGVGFRPLVYRYAQDHQLSGFVLNHSQGVSIEIQGQQADVEGFITKLQHSPPPLSRIDRFEQIELAIIEGCHQFEITTTRSQTDAVVVVPTDKSCCDDCLSEMAELNNRHFQYPFTNCTNCGPRYTLIKKLPYDRPHTSMANFSLCPECQRSYNDPLDRRYHAQPVSCPACGPQLRLLDPQGQPLAEKQDALSQCIRQIKQGKIVAIKGLGGFHLVCDASNDSAVKQLRQRKNRPAKPLAVMVANQQAAADLVSGNEQEWQCLQSLERPIVLMSKQPQASLHISGSVAPDIDKLGIFLPYTPLHHLLIDALNCPIVASSANISGEPVIIDSKEIVDKLGHVIDYILDHDRAIINACDDSVVQVTAGQIQVIRLARGYAPLSLAIDKPVEHTLLAVGAQQKNTLAFAFDHNIFVSPHIGDLFSLEAEAYFDNTIATFKRLYQLKPRCIVHDKHPDYAPTRWSKALQQRQPDIQRLTVQHHFAHVLSVMAMHQLTGPVLGFSFDGTGLGDDGQLWGAEVLLTDINDYQRLGHLKPFRLIGGEQAIKDPRRIVLALMLSNSEEHQCEKVLARCHKLSCLSQYSANFIGNLAKVHQSSQGDGGACPQTSSMGRLFDAVACALGLITVTQFEGQAGMLLEAAANKADKPVDFVLLEQQGQWLADELFHQIIIKLEQQAVTASLINNIAAGFMQAIGNAVLATAKKYPQLPVVLCGGVFQNRYLTEYTQTKLQQADLTVLSNGLIPVNDAGIALGQIWYGIHHR